LVRPPSILTSLPRWTVTARLQASGQSSGHAVSTTVAGPPSFASDEDIVVRYHLRELTMQSNQHVVIVGGGFGGLQAARAFRDAAVRVTLLDRHNYHLFQPLLYQVATASLSPGDIASPIRWILRRQKNVEVLLANVTAIDPAANRLTADGESIAFDYL